MRETAEPTARGGDAIVRGLGAHSENASAGFRAQVYGACGTGKSVIGATAAKRLVPHGRVLIVVPTLGLLTQTIKAWQNAGHTGPYPSPTPAALRYALTDWEPPTHAGAARRVVTAVQRTA
ncbi:DEAD/DEAH box helicase family protein [Streptodolium elevatio]|uniref:DEAD/DEAH box helicase family protein n=1 Tax=Streptodolium elevatio TaxID=3157996 RepID=A0ABV3DST7_9ACTN